MVWCMLLYVLHDQIHIMRVIEGIQWHQIHSMQKGWF